MGAISIGDIDTQFLGDKVNTESSGEEIASSLIKIVSKLNNTEISKEVVSRSLLNGVRNRLKKKTQNIEEILEEKDIILTGNWLFDEELDSMKESSLNKSTNLLNEEKLKLAKAMEKVKNDMEEYEKERQGMELKLKKKEEEYLELALGIEQEKKDIEQQYKELARQKEELERQRRTFDINIKNIDRDAVMHTAKKLDTNTESSWVPVESNDEYNFEMAKKDIVQTNNLVADIERAIHDGHNILLSGVPGCGKTYAARKIAQAVVGREWSNRILQIEFSEGTDYTDLILGLKPDKNGELREVEGSILKFCRIAQDNEKDGLKFVLILNEITRANTEAVLGELFTHIEMEYRGVEISLSNGSTFVVPKNLVIIGTMNDTDRSVKNIDRATKERFRKITVDPIWDCWSNTEGEQFRRLIEQIKGSKVDKQVVELCTQMSYFNTEVKKAGRNELQIGQRQLLVYKNIKRELDLVDIEKIKLDLKERIEDSLRARVNINGVDFIKFKQYFGIK